MGGSWLDSGHGDGESLAHVTGVPARDVVAPSDRGSASWNSRSTKAVVGALATLALIGSAGTAYAIRETLFPSLGAPTSRSVWTNTPAPDESAEVTVSSVTTLDVDRAAGNNGSCGDVDRAGNGHERGGIHRSGRCAGFDAAADVGYL